MKTSERKEIASCLSKLKQKTIDNDLITLFSYLEDCFWDGTFHSLKQEEINSFENLSKKEI